MLSQVVNVHNPIHPSLRKLLNVKDEERKKKGFSSTKNMDWLYTQTGSSCGLHY